MVMLRFAAGLAALFAFALVPPASAGETPKYGGILNFVIPGRPVLQRADPRQSDKSGLDDRFCLRFVHRDAAAER